MRDRDLRRGIDCEVVEELRTPLCQYASRMIVVTAMTRY